MGAGIINLVVAVRAMPCADAWGRELTEEGKASPAAVATKVRFKLVLDEISFKENQAGQEEVGITPTAEMKLGEDRETMAITPIATIGPGLGTTSRDGLVRIMGEEEVLFSRGSEEMVMGYRLEDRLMLTCFIKQFKPWLLRLRRLIRSMMWLLHQSLMWQPVHLYRL
jgi:hypothetical protein